MRRQALVIASHGLRVAVSVNQENHLRYESREFVKPRTPEGGGKESAHNGSPA